MDLGLKGKFALVTAASRGLGYAAASAIAAEGAAVMICSRDREAIRRAASEISGHSGAPVVPVVADVSAPAGIRRLERMVREEFGTLHILISNAGGPPRGDILTMDEPEWRRGFELTLMSTVRLVRAFLPGMIAQRWGRVVTITSVAAKQPINDLLLSAVFRPGVHALSKVVSNRHAGANVTVNTVCPGYILTSRQKEILEARAKAAGKAAARLVREMTREIPAGRMGRPEEIGEVIAFLASERASYINGVNLLVDGGLAKGIY
ncbi:MAG TPA: SDR family oxidoreductase [Bacteroidota bacterium]|nr:SDR family oxidoreductase [Bacteroidota bacterium]